MFGMININVFSMTEHLRGGFQTYPIKYQQFRKRSCSLLTRTCNCLHYIQFRICTYMTLMTLKDTGLHCVSEPNM